MKVLNLKLKKKNILKSLEKLQQHYSTRGVNLVCISGKWSFRTAENLSDLMSQQKSVQKKLSKAAIETLAIIVYHQPVTRAEIEEIRGVSFGTNTLEILLELNWVKPHGRRDVPGRPIQYVTTEDFLSHFNLQKLSDLPNVEELASAGLIDGGNIDSSIFGTKTFFKEKQEEKKEIYKVLISSEEITNFCQESVKSELSLELNEKLKGDYLFNDIENLFSCSSFPIGVLDSGKLFLKRSA